MCRLPRDRQSRLTAFVVVTTVVNEMDSPVLFPCKLPQLCKTFEAFAATPYGRAREPAA